MLGVTTGDIADDADKPIVPESFVIPEGKREGWGRVRGLPLYSPKCGCYADGVYGICEAPNLPLRDVRSVD